MTGKHLGVVVCLAASLGLGSALQAGTVYGPGAGFSITDFSSGSSSIVIGDSLTIVSLSVSIDITHTWVGDLIISLIGPPGTVILLDRPGVPPGSVGNSDNLSGIYTFADGGSVFPEGAGSVTVPPGTFAPAESLAAFAGDNTSGTWTLLISDNANGDTGGVTKWSLDIETEAAQAGVPEPASMVLWGSLGLVGLVAGRRRNRALAAA